MNTPFQIFFNNRIFKEKWIFLTKLKLNMVYVDSTEKISVADVRSHPGGLTDFILIWEDDSSVGWWIKKYYVSTGETTDLNLRSASTIHGLLQRSDGDTTSRRTKERHTNRAFTAYSELKLLKNSAFFKANGEWRQHFLR